MAEYKSDNNYSTGGFWTILGIILFLYFAYISSQTPSSREQSDHDFYQENGMTKARYDYLQSEDSDEVY